MAKRRATKTVDNWKKKKWYPIFATKYFRETQIGDTITEDPTTMIGKTVRQNMMSLSGDIRKKDTEITFKIIDYKDSRGVTEIIKFEILPSSIKRKIRRSKDRLDESFLAKTKDDRLVRIKPMLLTINNTKSSTQKMLRKTLKQELLKYLNTTAYENVFTDVISRKLQKSINEKLKKIYPMKLCEIRKLELAVENRKNKNVEVLKEEKAKESEEDDDSAQVITAEPSETKEEETPAEEKAPEAKEEVKEKASEAKEEAAPTEVKPDEAKSE